MVKTKKQSDYTMLTAICDLYNKGEIDDIKGDIRGTYKRMLSDAASSYRRNTVLRWQTYQNELLLSQLRDLHYYNLDELSNIKLVTFKEQMEKGEAEVEGKDLDISRNLDNLEQVYEVIHETVEEISNKDKELKNAIDAVVKKNLQAEKDLCTKVANDLLNELAVEG